MPLILASASPRRQELLSIITKEFIVNPPNIPEDLPPNVTTKQGVELLATAKALAIFTANPTSVVIGCDTVVEIDGEILGKPATPEQAFEMLTKLSGKTHRVFTATAVFHSDGNVVDCNVTEVTFHTLSPEEITQYIATNEPMDKAGGYGIQGVGSLLVKSINGDYYSVMGLPISTLSRTLKPLM